MDMSQADIEDLREELARRESARDDLTDRYMGVTRKVMGKPEDETDRPWVRKVEVDGGNFPVDMRRLTSREFVTRATALAGRDVSERDQLELFQFVFEGMTDEAVGAFVAQRKGYEDYYEVLRIEGDIFDALDLKN